MGDDNNNNKKNFNLKKNIFILKQKNKKTKKNVIALTRECTF